MFSNVSYDVAFFYLKLLILIILGYLCTILTPPSQRVLMKGSVWYIDIDMKRIRFSDLDIEILLFISDMKFASAEVIHERFFESRGIRYPKKRLKDYVDAGLLNRVLEWGGRSYLYLISDEGSKILSRKGFDVVPTPLKGIDLKNYEHDRALTLIRVKLENSQKVSGWVSERSIRFGSLFLRLDEKTKIIPDAYCCSAKDGNTLIIEFENSRKSNDRIRKLLKNYQLYFVLSKKSDERVIFFFLSESLLKSYKSIFSKLNLNFPAQFVLARDIGVDAPTSSRHWRL